MPWEADFYGSHQWDSLLYGIPLHSVNGKNCWNKLESRAGGFYFLGSLPFRSPCIDFIPFLNATALLWSPLHMMYVLTAQLCLTFCDPMHCSPPGASVSGIFQARILEWVAISSSRGSSWPRDWTQVSCISWISRQILYHCATWEDLNWPQKLVKWPRRLRPHRAGSLDPCPLVGPAFWLNFFDIKYLPPFPYYWVKLSNKMVNVDSQVTDTCLDELD